MQFHMISSLLVLLSILPSFTSALDTNCSDATSTLLFANKALVKASYKHAQFMVNMCGKQPNNVCSIKNETIGEDIHYTTIVNMSATEAYKINAGFNNACKNAGGLVASETFDIGLMSDGDYLQMYSKEEKHYIDSSFYGKYFDFSVTGYLDCVAILECKNATEIVDIGKNAWAAFFNATLYNFTLYDIQLENITFPK
jgi:hypothetical protein